MLARIAPLALASALAVGCAVDAGGSPAALDELDRTTWTTVVPPDAGTARIVETAVPLGKPSSPPVAPHHDCHDPCPGPCAADEACCAATQRCVSLRCPSCCPDPRFGFDAIRAAVGDR